ncbi:MAG: DegT/DnrJ/EryC1/StrS family aminotransferase [Neomegalonema sp.]|nr:DegT/DnrJ/EryC1/StrS family aminotransferase [Neomegalonema sp.]
MAAQLETLDFHPSEALAALAVFGGAKTRATPMPKRNAFGPAEVEMLQEAISVYSVDGPDPGYEGQFEQAFCAAFTEFMGGGYADAVATGTGSVFVALEALAPQPGSEVLISPIVDPGPFNCILYQGCDPVVVDAAPGSYNAGADQFLECVTDRTSAAIIVHAAGEPVADIERLCAELKARGVKTLEDCSQAPGARVGDRVVGSFGDIAALSTMYRKALSAGASGGLVYTRDLTLHRRALASADRGKPAWRKDYDFRNPGAYLFPALNWNTDELSCAIGLASLRRLPEVIAARQAFVQGLAKRLRAESAACRAYDMSEGASPFFLPIWVDQRKVACRAREFAEALSAEGVDLNPEYGFVVTEWEWARPHMRQSARTPNAIATRDRSFNLFVNEQYGETEIDDIVAAIMKVEAAYLRR